MGEVIRFIAKSERERARLIREARAIYDSIFSPSNAVSEQPDTAPAGHAVSGAMPSQRRGSLMIKIIAVLCISPLRQLPRADRHHLGLR
jgi:hypothetical protein